MIDKDQLDNLIWYIAAKSEGKIGFPWSFDDDDCALLLKALKEMKVKEPQKEILQKNTNIAELKV